MVLAVVKASEKRPVHITRDCCVGTVVLHGKAEAKLQPGLCPGGLIP